MIGNKALTKNKRRWTKPGADELEHVTPLYSCHGVFSARSIFRSIFAGMILLWECHDQSQKTYWRHCVTGPELPFFHKREGILKIDQSVKMRWQRLSRGVACSYSSAPDKAYKEKKSKNILTEFRRFFQRLGDHHLGYQFRSTFDHPKM